MAVENAAAFEGWCVLELMGHRRLIGFVSEQQIAGAGFIRIDVLAGADEPAATQLYSPSAVYAITPCTEETARASARLNHVGPVSRWELPAPREEHKRPFERDDWNDRLFDEGDEQPSPEDLPFE